MAQQTLKRSPAPKQKSTASRAHRLADRGLDRGLLLLLPATLFAFFMFIYPFLYGIGLTFQPTQGMQEQWGGGIFANYFAFFKDSFTFDTVWITLRLAVPAALFNVLISIPIAFKLNREFRGKRTLLTMLVLPITLGTVLTSQGMLILLGRSGWLNRFLVETGIADEPLQLTMNYTGVFISLIISGFPFAFLLVSSYLSGIDPSLDKAARTLGATWWSRFRRITLPLLAPGLATTFVLTFVLAFSVFPSARLVGDALGSTRVIALVAYRAFGEQNDYTMASTIAMMLGLIQLVVVAIVFAGRSLLYKGPASGGKG